MTQSQSIRWEGILPKNTPRIEKNSWRMQKITQKNMLKNGLPRKIIGTQGIVPWLTNYSGKLLILLSLLGNLYKFSSFFLLEISSVYWSDHAWEWFVV